MEIQARVPTTEIQTGSQNTLRNGHPSWFPQRRSKVVPKTHYTMEIQGASHNGDPSRFPQCVSALGG